MCEDRRAVWTYRRDRLLLCRGGSGSGLVQALASSYTVLTSYLEEDASSFYVFNYLSPGCLVMEEKRTSSPREAIPLCQL